VFVGLANHFFGIFGRRVGGDDGLFLSRWQVGPRIFENVAYDLGTMKLFVPRCICFVDLFLGPFYVFV